MQKVMRLTVLSAHGNGAHCIINHYLDNANAVYTAAILMLATIPSVLMSRLKKRKKELNFWNFYASSIQEDS